MPDQKINKKPFYDDECPIIQTFEIIGGKWRLPILFVIYRAKSIRYNELKRNLPGITNIMLTRSLQSLEEHGLVKRKDFNRIPPHVEYSLTDICKDLAPAYETLNELSQKLSEQHHDKI